MQGLSSAPPAAFLLLLLLRLSSLLPVAAVPVAERELNPSSRLAAGAARVALHYLNFQTASPGELQALGQVRKATVKVGEAGGERAGAGFRATLGKVQLILIIIMKERGSREELSRPQGGAFPPPAAGAAVLPSGGSGSPQRGSTSKGR